MYIVEILHKFYYLFSNPRQNALLTIWTFTQAREKIFQNKKRSVKCR